MEFCKKLNEYLVLLECSSKELSEESGLSESVISRYRNGERTPLENSEQIKKISGALFKISESKGIGKFTEFEIFKDLNASVVKTDDFDYEVFSRRFNEVITALKINVNEMAKSIVFDPSHLSRIKNGKTRPSEPLEFSKKVCNYISSKYCGSKELDILSNIGCNLREEMSKEEMFNALFEFLTSPASKEESKDYIGDFLENLDKFNLNDYIKVIKFDELKVPTVPFYKTGVKKYYGLEEMKKGELDFFKATVLSRSKEDIFMHSDMPMEDMSEDIDFGKKWMFAIAMSLKKGLHLNIIHNLDRPFNEMMLGLESWIPIYMTGQISPYYLKETKNSVYNHLNYVSGKYALCGECIKDHHKDGRYVLTDNAKEVEYFKKKAGFLLNKANPLMEIYDIDNKNKFNIFSENDAHLLSERRRILHSLPIFTISDELLEEILKRNNISSEEMQAILDFKHSEENRTNEILKENIITDVISNDPSERYLSLENMFYDKKISYTPDEFARHLVLTKNYNNKNYRVINSEKEVFKNISITMARENYVLISKISDPCLHFVIKHPKLRQAIENFTPLVTEKI